MAPCHATKRILNILQSGQNLLSSKDSILSDDDLVLDNLSSIPMAATAAVILKPIFMSDLCLIHIEFRCDFRWRQNHFKYQSIFVSFTLGSLF